MDADRAVLAVCKQEGGRGKHADERDQQRNGWAGPDQHAFEQAGDTIARVAGVSNGAIRMTPSTNRWQD